MGPGQQLRLGTGCLRSHSVQEGMELRIGVLQGSSKGRREKFKFTIHEEGRLTDNFFILFFYRLIYLECRVTERDRQRNGEREVFHPLVDFPDDYNSRVRPG